MSALGYTRSARLVDMMAAEGIVGTYKGSKAREVYYTLDEWEQAKEKRAAANEQVEETEPEESDETEESEDSARSDC